MLKSLFKTVATLSLKYGSEARILRIQETRRLEATQYRILRPGGELERQTQKWRYSHTVGWRECN